MISSTAEQQQIAQPAAAAPSPFRVVNVVPDANNKVATVTIALSTPTSSPDVAFLRLKSFDAKKIAIAEASKKGIPAPGVQQAGNPYPVDKDGNRMIKMAADSVIHSWQADIVIAASVT